ncbi:MAG: FG-GAP-like repeat-containing protein [Candidatus Eisenbacteria bacterium]
MSPATAFSRVRAVARRSVRALGAGPMSTATARSAAALGGAVLRVAAPGVAVLGEAARSVAALGGAVLASAVLASALLSQVAHAEAPGPQTDWSGGGGVPGPVASFGDEFDSGTLAWSSLPGQLALPSATRATFPKVILTPDSDRPTRLAIADIDADGHQDIIVTDPLISPFDPNNRRGGIYLWRQVAGAWTRTSITEDFFGAWYVDAVDLDLDGDLDLIASAYYGEIDPPPPPPSERNGRYAWFENLDGVGGAWEKRELGELFWGARWIDAADLDGDGDLDLAGCAELVGGPYEADAFVVWFENVDGQGEEWIQHDISLDFDNAFAIYAADIDGDDDVDLFVSGYDRFEWFENLNGSASSWTRHVISPVFQGAGYLDIGDLDQDGDIDIFGGGLNTGVLAVWLNDGTGLGWSAFIVGPFTRGYNVDLADFDGDGDLDAVASGESSTTTSKVAYAENLGSGSAWSLHYADNLAPSSPWVRAGDVDRDGKLELVASFEDSYNVGVQLAAYTVTDFGADGSLESSILDGGAGVAWGAITWDADVPSGAALDIDVRASNDTMDLGPWVPVPTNGTQLGALVDPAARYIQYRVVMTGAAADESPVLRELVLESVVPASVDGEAVASLESAAILTTGPALPNPSRASTVVTYELTTPSRVRVTVHDAAGRELAPLEASVVDAGRHEVTWDGLDRDGAKVPAGTYFIRVQANHEAATRRVVRLP